MNFLGLLLLFLCLHFFLDDFGVGIAGVKYVAMSIIIADLPDYREVGEWAGFQTCLDVYWVVRAGFEGLLAIRCCMLDVPYNAVVNYKYFVVTYVPSLEEFEPIVVGMAAMDEYMGMAVENKG